MEGRARPVGLGLILISLSVTLGGGLLFKGPCVSGDWGDGRQYLRLCYTDIIPLYGTEQLQDGRLPYLDPCVEVVGSNCDEYPLLTMYTMRVAAWTTDTFGGFFAANAAILTFAAVVIASSLVVLAGRRALYFALAPTLLIYGYLNWDLVAVAFATAGTLAFLRDRNVMAGVLLGLGAAAKLYPALLVLPFIAHRFKRREPDAGIHLAWAAVGTWLAVNLPFLLLAPGEWFHFFSFNAERGADWDSLWFGACDAVTGNTGCVPLKLLNLGSLVAFLGLSILVWRWRKGRDPGFPRWTAGFPLVALFLLTNKVYSPQYSLWVIPWFALAFQGLRPRSRLVLFGLFSAADVAVFVTRFLWFARFDDEQAGMTTGLDGVPIEAFEIAIWVRAVVLAAAVVAWARQRPVPREEEAEMEAAPAGAAA